MSNQIQVSNEKSLTDRNGKSVHRGRIVRIGEGWMEVRSVYVGGQAVNLGPIFHSTVTRKKVPLASIFEDKEAWYAYWQTTDTYKCM